MLLCNYSAFTINSNSIIIEISYLLFAYQLYQQIKFYVIILIIYLNELKTNRSSIRFVLNFKR